MSPSYHHSYISSNLIAQLHKLEGYSVFSELTIQIDKDYIPDISLYPKRHINFVAADVLKMTEMPLLAIEILSPSQGTQEILDKFKVFFEAGIKSCWLVIPVAQAVMVYSSLESAKTFNSGNVVDENLNIKLSLQEIFS